jgi:hypothetical protein
MRGQIDDGKNLCMARADSSWISITVIQNPFGAVSAFLRNAGLDGG